MALSTGELVQLYSGRETEVVRAKTIAAMFCQRTYQSDLQRAYTVRVPTRSNTVAATSRSRGANWKTAQDTDITLQNFTIDQYSEVGNAIRFEDMIESPLDLMMTVADDQGYRHAERINSHIYSTIQAGVKTANRNVHGSNSIRLSGAGQATGAVNVLNNVFVATWHWLMTNNLLFTGERDYQAWMVVPPVIWRRLFDEVDSSNIMTVDSIGLDITREGRLLPSNPMSVGRYRGINVFVDNSIARIDDSSKSHWSCIAGVNAANEFANREPVVQYLTPQTNQTSPNYMIRSIRQYKAMVVENDLLYMALVRQQS